ncbi:2'-5' RNA ligase family protein [Rossellomorea aquimaris]|uniref:2'-5' RNA ligase family protein n=1 Tax=Rossellomorea aquimaris TaxID=189382 RepID=UPI001CD76E1A|nr:2'-5' RNA ligase family protein [Rossellomorea aquimaris]MCA1054066.1 2'-5' RNA ligase family protein [Rossellomorea aquimaris]
MYFIGIVPPQRELDHIEQFQSRWIPRSGVEPHITLKAQGGLASDLAWLDKIKKVCSDFKPFRLSLDKPKYFGDNILYLSVNSADIHQLHQKIVQAVAPSEDSIQQYFELDAFVPHLTLGKEAYGGSISSGLTKSELREMEKAAEVELTPYPEFDVNFIRVYELNIEEQRYIKYLDIFLGE